MKLVHAFARTMWCTQSARTQQTLARMHCRVVACCTLAAAPAPPGPPCCDAAAATATAAAAPPRPTRSYTSRVTLSPPHRVSSSVADSGLFHHLESTWALAPGPSPQTTWLSFSVDFAFSNPLYSNVASLFFSEVVQRMMGAFEGRASQLYGPPSFAPPARRAEALAAAAQLKQHQQAGHARRGAVLAGSGAGGGEHPQLLHAATEAAAAEAEAEAAAAAAQQGVVSRRQ